MLWLNVMERDKMAWCVAYLFGRRRFFSPPLVPYLFFFFLNNFKLKVRVKPATWGCQIEVIIIITRDCCGILSSALLRDCSPKKPYRMMQKRWILSVSHISPPLSVISISPSTLSLFSGQTLKISLSGRSNCMAKKNQLQGKRKAPTPTDLQSRFNQASSAFS